MNAYSGESTVVRLGRYVIVSLLLALFIGLVLLNYDAAVAVLAGVLLYFVLATLARPLVARLRGPHALWWLVGTGALVVVIAVTAVALLLVNATGFSFFPATLKNINVLKRYTVTVLPANPSLSNLQVKEELVIGSQLDESNNETVSLPPRMVAGTDRGFLLKQVSVGTITTDSEGMATITSEGGSPMSIIACCPQTTLVELKNWPKNSFYVPRNAESAPKIVDDDVDTQRIDWSMHDLTEGVSFTYIPPPFNGARSILAPLIGISTLSEWILALLSVLGTGVFKPVVSAVVMDAAKGKFKSWAEVAWTRITSRAGKPPQDKKTAPG